MTRSRGRCAAFRRQLLIAASVIFSACGGSGPAPQTADDEELDRPPVDDDRSLCAWRGRTDREVVESKSPGAKFPNVRRVFAIAGQGEDRRRILVCRETDTNLDGIKDVARLYDERGQAELEQVDSNYDGKLDTWLTFAGGRIARMEMDEDGDGRPDEVRFYLRGELSRVHRDTNRDGRPDIWEIYRAGRLERIGTDLDKDGHVDRWDRDEVARRLQQERERAEEEEQAGVASEGDAPVAPTIPARPSDEAAAAPSEAAAAPSETAPSPPRDGPH